MGHPFFKIISGTSFEKILTLSDKALDKFTGLYLDTYKRELTVIRDGSNLKMSGKGIPTVTLLAIKKNKFYMKDLDVEFEFVTSDSLIITANGKVDCTATKLK